MKRVPCPVSATQLQALYDDEKRTDEQVAVRLGEGATVKRVRSWRSFYGIEAVARTARHDVPPVEGRLRSLLVGSMLGDGRLNKLPNSTRFMEGHSEEQRAYLEWKAAEWGAWVKTPPAPVVWKQGERQFTGWRFATVAHPSLNEWHARFYAPEGGPKHLVREVVPLVDAFALAVWFMDDGSVGWWPRITFGMDVISQGIAMGIFDRLGFRPRWEMHKGNTGDFLFEGEEQAERFMALVKPHMPPCMAHKLVFGFQGPHYQIRQVLTHEALSDMASRGVPIRQMARELGVTDTTVDRHLTKLGIAHPRKLGRPPRGGV